MIGRRLVRLVASWHVYEGRESDAPVDLWLIDDQGVSTHIMSGTDWCLVVEASKPYESYDMGDWGRIDVRPVDEETPLASRVGEVVLGVREDWEPLTGRMGLELDFTSGSVRCESWSGDLRIRAVGSMP
ncbi:hypothetical protein GCM10009665_10820 [Kitasatospora nipponensis]|uniref:Uncharacterized protein n=1 Tax=Kitasatospora nipponensis TaxID=258049 RepID=A0ABP4GI96_9ACTN